MALGSGGGLTVGELTAFLTVDDSQFNQGIDRGHSKFSSFAKGLAGVAAAGVAAAGAAMAGLAVSGLKEFASFEKGMNEVFTLMPGVTDKAMGEMSDDVRDFAMEMGTATEDVVPALYSALSAGVPPGNVFDFLEVANKAALGGVTDLETAVDGITSVVNAYGEEVIDATKTSDLMFTAVRLGKTNFEELSSSLSNVIPIAAANKVAFADISAALATMTAQGIPTAQATTQMRQAIVELSDAGSDAGKAFERVANESFRDFIAGGGDMGDVMAILQEAAETSGVSVDQLFGSVEAGSAALALSGDNLEGFRDNIDEMAASADATQAAYDTMDSGISRALERIGVAWDDVKLVIGEQLAPVLQDLADWVIANMPAIRAKFDDLVDGAVEMGQALAAWWTETAKPAIDEFLAAVRDNWPRIEGIFESLGGVAQSLGDIIASVFGGMAEDTEEGASDMEASVGGLVTVLEFLADVADDVFGRLANRIEIVASAFSGDSERMGQALWDFNSDLVQSLADAAVGLSGFRQNVEDMVVNVLMSFGALPVKMAAIFRQRIGAFVQLGRDIVNGVISGIQSRVGELAASAASMAVRALRAARNAIDSHSPSREFMKLGQDMVDGATIGIDRTAHEAVRAVEDMVDGMATEARRSESSVGDAMKGLRAVLGDTANDLVAGVDLTAAQLWRLVDAAKGAIQSAKDEAANVADRFTDKLTEIQAKADDLAGKMAGSLGTIAEHFGRWRASIVAEAGLTAEQLDTLAGKVEAFAGRVGSAFASAMSVVSNLGSVEGLESSDVMDFLNDQLESAKNWSADLRELARAGLDEGLLQELAEAGPKAAPLISALLDAVAEGNLEAINKAQEDLHSILERTVASVGRQLEPAWREGVILGDGIARGIGEGLVARSKALQDQIQKMVRDLINAAAAELGVVAEAEEIARAAAPSFAMSGATGGGGKVVNDNRQFHFPNYVGDKRELIEIVRDGLVNDKRRVPGLEL